VFCLLDNNCVNVVDASNLQHVVKSFDLKAMGLESYATNLVASPGVNKLFAVSTATGDLMFAEFE
jgi:hypothetical protein